MVLIAMYDVVIEFKLHFAADTCVGLDSPGSDQCVDVELQCGLDRHPLAGSSAAIATHSFGPSFRKTM